MKVVNPANLKRIYRIKCTEVSFLVLILVSKMLITGSFDSLIYIFAAILHECGHLVSMLAFGCRSCKIRFVGFGFEITSKSVYSYRNEIVIGAMGPITNLAFASLVGILQFSFQNKSANNFIIANLVYAAINLMPIRPLDGYKIIYNWLCLSLEYNKARAIMKNIAIICLIIFCLSIVIVIIKDFYNYSLILLSLILIISTITQLILK